MKRSNIVRTIVILTAVSLAAPLAVPQVSAPSGKTLAATVGVYVFPAKGQEAQQQSQDESACYDWAVNNTGSDPFSLSKQSQQAQAQEQQEKEQAKKEGKGDGAKGALGGAAAGALIGEIASDDAGKGAAIGAGIGLLAGRRHKKKEQKQATAAAEDKAENTQRYTAGQMDAFKKAFSVCLEAKDYKVKF